MKKALLLTLIATTGIGSLSSYAQTGNEFGTRSRTELITQDELMRKAPAKEGPTIYDLMACPEGSVFASSYTPDAGFYSSQCADQDRPGMPIKVYEYFSGNCYLINGIRFYGFFNYYDADSRRWKYCNERGGIDENGVMTKPVKFEISFYKANGEGGYAGDEVYKKVVDVTGVQTGVQVGDSQIGTQSIYAFDVDFDQEIKMESGFIQISAAETEESPSCWFSLFLASSGSGWAYYDTGSYIVPCSDPLIFCFKGTGEFAANKALKLNRFISPTESASGKFERVQVEVSNAGNNTIDDAKLELWADGKCIATEDLDATLISNATYKHTFETRVDCSAPGVHEIEVRNVTPGDEKYCAETSTFEVTCQEATGEVGASVSSDCSTEYISNVTIGNFSNPSGASNYSDFRNIVVDIHSGEVLVLKVETQNYVTTAAWIDWNDNGILGEEGETINWNPADKTGEISIPENITLTEGPKLLRIVVSYYYSPEPVGEYRWGETEDYTINVVRTSDTPALGLEETELIEELNSDNKTHSLNIKNRAQGTLEGNFKISYVLPNTPASNFSTADPVETDPVDIVRRNIAPSARKATPAADAQATYTLRYDNGQSAAIGINNNEAPIYAQLYPGKMLAALNGMKLSSVDVYIADACTSSKVIIYGANTQEAVGDIITTQEFTAVSDEWNHIVLDNPLTIDGKDLWVAVQVQGNTGDGFHIGIDHGPATIGFGDRINIGGPNWWSMADLQYNYNFCIRANVSGEATPAISWLSLDNTRINVPASETKEHKLSYDASKLEANKLYEAVIDIHTNDELSPKVTIPVYLINGQSTGIQTVVTENDTRLNVEGSVITVEADKEVANVSLFAISGIQVAAVEGNVLDASNVANGVYLLLVKFADGSNESMKLLFNK